jgi:branched-chain amino acid transport system substrate-binding protein
MTRVTRRDFNRLAAGSAAAIAQVAEQRKIPFVINIAAAPQITGQGYKYTFRNFPTAVDLIRNGLSLLRDLFQATNSAPRTAIFMHVNDTFGQSMAKGIAGILPRLDYLPFKIVDTISYDPAARDLSVEVAKAKASGADMVMLVSRLNDAILLVREMVKQRWSPQGIMSPGSPGMYEEQFYKATRRWGRSTRTTRSPTCPGTTRTPRLPSGSRPPSTSSFRRKS